MFTILMENLNLFVFLDFLLPLDLAFLFNDDVGGLDTSHGNPFVHAPVNAFIVHVVFV